MGDDDERWAQRLGAACTESDVARLLGVEPAAVAARSGLLRIVQRDGRMVYPLFQFDGRSVIDGVGDVVEILEGAMEPLTVASWLTGRLAALDGARPIDLLRAGRKDEVADAARVLAQHAS